MPLMVSLINAYGPTGAIRPLPRPVSKAGGAQLAPQAGSFIEPIPPDPGDTKSKTIEPRQTNLIFPTEELND